MLFNSFTFLFAFLPLCLGLYFGLAKAGAARGANVALVLSSLAFYGYWRYEMPGGEDAHILLGYVLLLCASTGLNYWAGTILQKRPQRRLLGIFIAANLCVLGYFKYSGFGVRSINELLGTTWALSPIVLPLAISFYTFTQIAFLVDAYRGLASELSFARYCLFVFFFPHLIAGPIVHHSEIMPQFARPDAKRWNTDNACRALCWLSLGLFKKVVIADSVAPLANAAFAHAGDLTFLEAWAGTLAYAFQLYFDFSGYSDMAIGLSLFFNVRLPDNFDAPYRASDIVDFWRRWHITLSRFLRDYLYIPLGGNRHGSTRRYVNLFLTMLLGGIWHGAGWLFLFWGAYHGALLIVCHLWKERRTPLPPGFARALTFVAVLIGWILFRAPDVAHARDMLFALVDLRSLSLAGLSSGLQLGHLLWLAVLLIFVNVAPTTKEWVETQPLTTRYAMGLATLFAISMLLMRDVHLQFSKSEFIYFQF